LQKIQIQKSNSLTQRATYSFVKKIRNILLDAEDIAKNICMEPQKREDLNLRLGNLILAIFLATVPTAITYGTLSIHGLNICRNLGSTVIDSKGIKEKCDQAAWDTTKSYIILIGFFITLPTWMWFYLSTKKKEISN
tara:strand:+ start:122 stop:532 length:411 start_codon:yes stop_codon:yes gene_type:complete